MTSRSALISTTPKLEWTWTDKVTWTLCLKVLKEWAQTLQTIPNASEWIKSASTAYRCRVKSTRYKIPNKINPSCKFPWNKISKTTPNLPWLELSNLLRSNNLTINLNSRRLMWRIPTSKLSSRASTLICKLKPCNNRQEYLFLHHQLSLPSENLRKVKSLRKMSTTKSV